MTVRTVGIVFVVIALVLFPMVVFWAMVFTLPSHGHAEIGVQVQDRRVALLAYAPLLSVIGLHVAGVAMLLHRVGNRLRRIGGTMTVGVIPTWIATIAWLAFAPNGTDFARALELGDGAWVLGPIITASGVLLAGLVILGLGLLPSREQP